MLLCWYSHLCFAVFMASTQGEETSSVMLHWYPSSPSTILQKHYEFIFLSESASSLQPCVTRCIFLPSECPETILSSPAVSSPSTFTVLLRLSRLYSLSNFPRYVPNWSVFSYFDTSAIIFALFCKVNCCLDQNQVAAGTGISLRFMELDFVFIHFFNFSPSF